MDILLLMVTVVSLTLAASMTAVAWKLRHDARRRSDARVAVLEALAFGDQDDEESDEAPEPVRAPSRPTHAPIAQTPAERADEIDQEIDQEDLPGPSWDAALGTRSGRVISIRDDDRPSESPAPMFTPVVKTSPGARRVLVLAAVAIVMMGGVSAAYLIRGDFSWPTMTVTAAQTPAARENVAPLELLSLRHDVAAPGQFTVTGLVQNPQQGRPVSGLVAVVYLFDAQGRYLASGKIPIEYSSLRPGDEAPFVVTIPATHDEVSRYRVGFRLGDGAVVAHVDRRGQAPANTTGDAIEPEPPAGRARRVEG